MASRDEFDDPEGFFSRLITVNGRARGSFFENRSLWISAIVFVLVVALSGVIWASYPAQNPLATDGTVPIIRADAQPYKSIPDDRGGMAIPHRESTIFDAMRDGDADRKVENLLGSQDEQPMDRQELFAGLKTDLTDSTVNDATSTGSSDDDANLKLARMGDYTQERPLSESERRAQAARRNREMLEQEAEPLPGDVPDAARKLPPVLKSEEIEPDLAPKPIKKAADSVPPEKNAPTQDSTQELVSDPDQGRDDVKPPVKVSEPKTATPDRPVRSPETDVTIAAPEKPVKSKVQTGVGSTYVQVSSVPDENRVTGEWATLSGKLPMISGLPYRTQRADLGAKGIFYRIQVGPMSRDDAVRLCDQIKAKKPGGCLIAK